MFLNDGEQVIMNQGDMASAFYLFAVPPAWYPFFCLNYRINGKEINRDPEQFFRPAIRVLPMGWSSSVGVMQQVSREILLAGGLPPNLEVRKSLDLPTWFTEVLSATTATTAWWQVYLDNFFSGEKDLCGEGDAGVGAAVDQFNGFLHLFHSPF